MTSELSACLIVRDEAARLPDCLASLVGVVDEVIIYDTGSTDGTVALARGLGARVIEGYWDDDFSRARNALLAEARSTWVLSLDADDRFDGSSQKLRSALRAAAENLDGFRIETHNLTGVADADSYSAYSIRLFRPATMHWTGVIHERPEPRPSRAGHATHASRTGHYAELPFGTFRLVHVGYSDPEEARRKAARNATLGLAELNALNAENETTPVSPERLARTFLDLGRSLMACDQAQGAADAFNCVRQLPVRGAEFAQATDFTARLALAANQSADAAELIEQLRQTGAEPHYCDWLDAQVRAQQGDAAGAYERLSGITSLVDPGGRSYGLGPVLEMRALAASLAGDLASARADLLEAMASYGRIHGRGELLREWLHGDPREALAAAFARHGDRHRAAVEAELDRWLAERH